MKETAMKLTFVNPSLKLERLRSLSLAAILATLVVMPGAAVAQTALTGISPAFREAIPNIPGKSITGIVVDYAPGGKSPSHRHARSAFIVAYVLSGAIRSQVNDGPVQVFHAGQSWTEQPGSHHRVSENASTTEPAKLLAIFVADTNDTELTTNDPQ
jgi:quercetin dioxygenase-like cupin family protein